MFFFLLFFLEEFPVTAVAPYVGNVTSERQICTFPEWVQRGLVVKLFAVRREIDGLLAGALKTGNERSFDSNSILTKSAIQLPVTHLANAVKGPLNTDFDRF